MNTHPAPTRRLATLPSLGWFRTFEAAARCQSFTMAAEELGLTQSAVSQQVKLLEHRLGCALFVRKHRAIALTDDGRRLLPEVSQAISALRSATAAFDTPLKKEQLIIATSVSVAQWFLAPAIQEFLNSHPAACIRLVTSVWPAELDESRANVQIRFGAPPAAETHSQPLGSNKLVLVASPRIVDSNRNVHLGNAEIKSHALIQTVGTTDSWRNCAGGFGYDTDHEATYQMDSHGLAVDFAVSGAGIALTSELVAMPSLVSGKLVRVNPHRVDAADGFHIWASRRSASNLSTHFVEWLLEHVAASSRQLPD